MSKDDGIRREGRIVPHNEPAEVSLLGAAMLSAEAAEVAVTETTTTDYFFPRHQAIHRAISKLYHAGVVKIDPVLVWDEVMTDATDASMFDASYLITLQSSVPTTSSARHYANAIVEAATKRDLLRVAGEIVEVGYDPSVDGVEAIDRARSLLGSVDMPIGSGEPSPNIEEILSREITFDWLVPGLIERMDRLILTGPEGGGKSTLLRQIAMCLAAGIHPFTFAPVDPVRVLIVDVENSALQVQRKSTPLYEIVKNRINPDNLRIENHPQGLDLLQRHDHRWLLERIAANRPDVLITGPIYKMHADDPNAELPARRVAAAFDGIRARFKCALILEAHSGHGNGDGRRPVRPIGASLWMRWPEFGYGLSPIRAADAEERGTVSFVPWRGPRDTRDWPDRLERGNPGNWPWVDPDAPVVRGEDF